jgi:hypothetical protein
MSLATMRSSTLQLPNAQNILEDDEVANLFKLVFFVTVTAAK